MAGKKTFTYAEIAKLVNYPEPYTGNLFGNNIGMTLGTIGELLQDIKIENWNNRIPVIQSLIVSSTTNFPSYGLKAFVNGYDSFTTEEKVTFTLSEYQLIFEFGERWTQVLDALGITIDEINNKSSKQLYNPFGSEGSPEHIKLKEYIKDNGYYFGYSGPGKGIIEYPLRSGDFIDVVFKDSEIIRAYEAKSVRSGFDDIQRGIFQCVKYKAVLEAEIKVNIKESLKVDCSLVIETEMPKELVTFCEKLGIKYYPVKVNR